MSGSLDYSVLIAVAEKRNVYDLEDMLFYTDEVEAHLAKKREKNKKK